MMLSIFIVFICIIVLTQASAKETEKTLLDDQPKYLRRRDQNVMTTKTDSSTIASTISFDVVLGLSGVTGPNLDWSSRNAVAKTVAFSMEIGHSFVSYNQDPVSEKFLREVEYDVDATISIVNFPVEETETKLSTHELLYTRFNVSLPMFDEHLHMLSNGLQADMTKNANLLWSRVGNFDDDLESADAPSLSPVASNVMSSALEDAAGLPLWVFYVIFGFLIASIMLCCVCYFAASNICDPLFLACCPGMLSDEILIEVEKRSSLRAAQQTEMTLVTPEEVDLSMVSIYGDSPPKKPKKTKKEKKEGKNRSNSNPSSPDNATRNKKPRTAVTKQPSTALTCYEEPSSRYAEHFDY